MITTDLKLQDGSGIANHDRRDAITGKCYRIQVVARSKEVHIGILYLKVERHAMHLERQDISFQFSVDDGACRPANGESCHCFFRRKDYHAHIPSRLQLVKDMALNFNPGMPINHSFHLLDDK